ncbi:hypothetical protein BKA57DRAFT_459091 [Linnemannia elongata]|nr:hypothetical protein BKA57DRAFT_459091 [Linnemannia elongata]
MQQQQQQRHPLEIPETLALVGSFLHLWNPIHPSVARVRFEPKTLATCIRVSKLWHKTLLPILWAGYWSYIPEMRDIPAAILHHNSHHLRILYLSRFTVGDVDLTQINCTSLVDLDIYVEEAGKGAGEGGGGEGVIPLLPVKRLLRSNRQLMTLNWTGVGNPSPLLDADDFAGLVGLKNLTVDNWDVSNGRLGMVLRNVAVSLKELAIERMYNVEPMFLNSEEFMLDRLESLVWVGGEGDNGDKSLSDLVKRSPRLKTLVSFAKHSDGGLRRLAETLGTSCPDFESLELHEVLQTQELETLIRYCSPGRPQLRKLRFAVQSLEDGDYQGLVAAILRHASTLEVVKIYRSKHGMDASVCLRLLTECPRLTHFAFFAKHPPFDLDFLERLKQQNRQHQQAAWGCRETLQELRLDLGFIYLNRRQTDTEREEKEEILSKMGWKIVNKDEEDDEPIDGVRMKEALEFVCLQRLEGLQLLILNQIKFRRVPFVGPCI